MAVVMVVADMVVREDVSHYHLTIHHSSKIFILDGGYGGGYGQSNYGNQSGGGWNQGGGGYGMS